jgi:hypothetical protein
MGAPVSNILNTTLYVGKFFLDPEGVMNLSMGAIWNFGKGTGLL